VSSDVRYIIVSDLDLGAENSILTRLQRGRVSDRQRCVEVLSAEHATILDLEGEIDILTATDFKTALLQSIESGERRIVVDATKVSFMDSSGVSVAISGQVRLRPLGGSLTIVCGDNVARILRVAGLEGFLMRSASLDEALRKVLGDGGSSAGDSAPETH
jgi:anti-sigma B factor antagonist